MRSQTEVVHPAWLRTAHWLNALAVVVLMMSGWRIYNATAFLGFAFPKEITLGGWLGGALQWHFAAMWLLAGNGLLYRASIWPPGAWGSGSFPYPRAPCWPICWQHSKAGWPMPTRSITTRCSGWLICS